MHMRNILSRSLSVLMVALTGAAVAQDAPAAPEAAAPKPAPWSARCVSAGKTAEPECVMEQRVVMSNTGNLLAGITIRKPKDSPPVMMIQTPYGLFLPPGLKLSVDGKDLLTIPVQTCDNTGCYAGAQIEDTVLAAMKAGNALTLTFQDQAQRPIDVPVALVGFTAAFDQIQ